MKSKKTLKPSSKTKKPKSKKNRKSLSYYLVLSKDKRTNFGAFPATKEGYSKAKEWALKMKKETGQDCMVKKH
jgi:hypothetical protein